MRHEYPSLSSERAILNENERRTFEDKYGKLLDLLEITVDGQMMKYMLHFWDHSYWCFTFRSIELTPMIEKYSEMLWPSSLSPIRVYLPNLNDNPCRHLASMLDLKAREVTQIFIKKGK